MRYFQDLEFGIFDHLPRCSVWIDRYFPTYCGLNYAHAGNIRWKVGPDEQDIVTLTAPVAWWTWPGPRFQYGCGPETFWDHYYVTFFGPRIERFIDEELLPTRVTAAAYTPIAQPEEFRREWDTLFGLLRRNGGINNPEAVHCLEGMLLMMRYSPIPLVDSPYRVAIEATIATINTHPEQEWDWDKEASHIGVSVVHFRRLFRNITGFPPHQYLLRTRMESAALLLRTTLQPIKTIASAVGLPDRYHFSKQFRAHFRLPPQTYRKAVQTLYGIKPIEPDR